MAFASKPARTSKFVIPGDQEQYDRNVGATVINLQGLKEADLVKYLAWKRLRDAEAQHTVASHNVASCGLELTDAKAGTDHERIARLTNELRVLEELRATAQKTRNVAASVLKARMADGAGSVLEFYCDQAKYQGLAAAMRVISTFGHPIPIATTAEYLAHLVGLAEAQCPADLTACCHLATAHSPDEVRSAVALLRERAGAAAAPSAEEILEVLAAADTDAAAGGPDAPARRPLDPATAQLCARLQTMSIRDILTSIISGVSNDRDVKPAGPTASSLPDACRPVAVAEGFAALDARRRAYDTLLKKKGEQFAKMLRPLGVSEPVTSDTIMFSQLVYGWVLQQYLESSLGFGKPDSGYTLLSRLMTERAEALRFHSIRFVASILREIKNEMSLGVRFFTLEEATPEAIRFLTAEFPQVQAVTSEAAAQADGTSSTAVLVKGGVTKAVDLGLFRKMFEPHRQKFISEGGNMAQLADDSNVDVVLTLPTGLRVAVVSCHWRSSGEHTELGWRVFGEYARMVRDKGLADMVILAGDTNKVTDAKLVVPGSEGKKTKIKVAARTNAAIREMVGYLRADGFEVAHTDLERPSTVKTRCVTVQDNKRLKRDRSRKIEIMFVTWGYDLLAVTDFLFVGKGRLELDEEVPSLPCVEDASAWGDHAGVSLVCMFDSADPALLALLTGDGERLVAKRPAPELDAHGSSGGGGGAAGDF